MDIQRIRRELMQATTAFALVEAHPTNDGGVYVKTVLRTSASNTYFVQIYFPDYPNRMPKVFITYPKVRSDSPHQYNDGTICYLHPNMWNPGRHSLTFVIWRTAKWLNKYDVWMQKGYWPGAEILH